MGSAVIVGVEESGEGLAALLVGGVGLFVGRETPPVVARLSQNCWLSNTSENHPVEVFDYGSEAFFR